MSALDPSHELPKPTEPLDLPPPHRHGGGWAWLFALVISSAVTFALSLLLLATGRDIMTVAVVAPIVFIFGTFVARAVADRAD